MVAVSTEIIIGLSVELLWKQFNIDKIYICIYSVSHY